MARRMDLDMNEDSLVVELGRDVTDHRSTRESVALSPSFEEIRTWAFSPSTTKSHLKADLMA